MNQNPRSTAARHLSDLQWSSYEKWIWALHLTLGFCSLCLIPLGFDAYFKGAGPKLLASCVTFGLVYPTYLLCALAFRQRQIRRYRQLANCPGDFQMLKVRIIRFRRSWFHPLFEERTLALWCTDEDVWGEVMLPEANIKAAGSSIFVAVPKNHKAGGAGVWLQ